MANLQVAETILQQLGGRQFVLLTGSRGFVGSPNSLMFLVGANAKRIAKCRITLTPADTYTVEFFKRQNDVVEPFVLSEEPLTDVYYDQLQDIFEDRTGLYVTLQPRG